jgi:alkyl sulfatase BDS1-like metallo-beta-lactamase superfamily hydrolase
MGCADVLWQCPESEAPSEFVMFYPQHRVLNMSEVACKNFHNLYTLRGAQIRDGALWSSYITHCLVKYAPQTDIVIAQHHWPTFGRERIINFLTKQRDIYKFVTDQTLRLANNGYTPIEIAESLRLPAGLETEFSVRDYYGSLSHNAKATYQRYLGWYDGNPANLNPLPPTEEAKKQVEYMGGAEKVMEKAKLDFEKGEYRWVVTVCYFSWRV